MSFGSVLSELLEQNNLRQRQLAENLHLSPSAVGKYIRDERVPDLNTVKRIAQYFSVSTDMLLEYYTDSPSSESYRQMSQILSQLSPDDRQIWLEQGKVLVRIRKKKEDCYEFRNRSACPAGTK